MADTNYPNSPVQNSKELGEAFQDFVMLEMIKNGVIIQLFTSKKYQYSHGESVQGYEIKLDQGIVIWKHLSVEVAEKSCASNQFWVESGVCKKDNAEFYIHGNEELFFIFKKSDLAKIGKQRESTWKVKHGTVATFYVEFDEAIELATFIYDPSNILGEVKETLRIRQEMEERMIAEHDAVADYIEFDEVW